MMRMTLGLLFACGLIYATASMSFAAEGELIAPGKSTNESSNTQNDAATVPPPPGKMKIGAATPQPQAPAPAAAPAPLRRNGALRAAIRKNLSENEALRSTPQGVVQNQLGPMVGKSGLGSGSPGNGAVPANPAPAGNPTPSAAPASGSNNGQSSNGQGSKAAEVIPAGATTETK